MKKKKVYIQRSLFGEDEIISVTENKPIQYDPYIKGAVDMFCRIVQIQSKLPGLPSRQAKIVHLPRRYMDAFCRSALKDRNFLSHFLSGGRFTFTLERDEYGQIKAAQAKIKPNKQIRK